jgi:hypothetical protein
MMRSLTPKGKENFMNNKSEPKNKSEPRKVWDHPTLTIFGSVESLTQGVCTNKNFGSSDGLTLMGTPITNACS